MDNRKTDLASYRVIQAEDSLKVAKMSFGSDILKDAINLHIMPLTADARKK